MFGHGVARAGCLQVPARADLVFDFLKVEWRTIQHYGVEIGGLRYDGPGAERPPQRDQPLYQQARRPLAAARGPRRRQPGLVPGPGRQLMARAALGARRGGRRPVQRRGPRLRAPPRGCRPPIPRHQARPRGTARPVGLQPGRRQGRAADGAAAVRKPAPHDPRPGTPAAGGRGRRPPRSRPHRGTEPRSTTPAVAGCAASPGHVSTPTAGAASATSSPAPPPGRSAATPATPACLPPRCKSSSPGSA